MARRDLEFLWKEYFRDPSQFSDNRNSKRYPRSPDFKHKQTGQALWADVRGNPPWVQEELRRRSPLKDGDSSAVRKDLFTLLELIKACDRQKDLCQGSRIHADIRRSGLLKKDIYVGTALIRMFAKCGALAKAQEVFDELPTRDVVSWTALIAGYAQHGLGGRALNCFESMRGEGLSPDAFTFVCILKACGSVGAIEKGEEIHAELRRLELLEKDDVVLGNALVDMYAKCGALAKAQEVFDELSGRNVVSWTALIAGYAQHGLGREALKCFGRMEDEGFSPNTVTFICILKACGSIGATEKGKEIHAKIHRSGLLENPDIVLGNALVDMYAKCGALAKAQEVFDELPARDVVSWTALIAGYALHGFGDEALKCFERMRDEGLSPDAATFVCILKACCIIGATEKGKEIHAEAIRLGLLENENNWLGNSLVDMYAKFGALAKAQEVFNELPARDVVSWTALIAGYAHLGNVEGVLNSFRKMVGEHIKPNGVTFLVLLTACSHAGLVEEGQMYFETMSTVYGITPTEEHLMCMVDLFSRAGHFDKAISMIEKVAVSEMWLALLGACRKWVNVELGRWAFEHTVRLDENCGTAYVCMSNIYAAASIQEEAKILE